MPATQRVFHIEHLLIGHHYTGHCTALRISAAEEAMLADCHGCPVKDTAGGDSHRRHSAHLRTKAAESQPACIARRAKIDARDQSALITAAIAIQLK